MTNSGDICLQILEAAMNRLTAMVDRLHNSFPKPRLMQYRHIVVMRYADEDMNNGVVCYLKAVKACSTLNAVVTLLKHGCHAQEAYALVRIAEDQLEDINLLLLPRAEGGLDALQEKVMEEFFQEEFADPTDPINTSQRRNRADRNKIRAASINRLDDPSVALAVAKMFYRAFSGYVHGAYVHIMELHSQTNLGRYEMRGTPARFEEAVRFIPNIVFHGMLTVHSLIVVAQRTDLLPDIVELRDKFEAEMRRDFR